MKLLMNFLIAIITSSLILTPVAYADDAIHQDLVATLQEGDPAPFSGTLFSTSAAASLLAELELTQETCRIKIDTEVGLNQAQMQLQVDNVQASLTACQLRYSEVITLKDQQIDFLDTQLIKASKPRNELWFALGVVGGIVLTSAAAWSLGQIAPYDQNP